MTVDNIYNTRSIAMGILVDLIVILGTSFSFLTSNIIQKKIQNRSVVVFQIYIRYKNNIYIIIFLVNFISYKV